MSCLQFWFWLLPFFVSTGSVRLQRSDWIPEALKIFSWFGGSTSLCLAAEERKSRPSVESVSPQISESRLWAKYKLIFLQQRDGV